jgi:hypothetical protein
LIVYIDGYLRRFRARKISGLAELGSCEFLPWFWNCVCNSDGELQVTVFWLLFLT